MYEQLLWRQDRRWKNAYTTEEKLFGKLIVAQLIFPALLYDPKFHKGLVTPQLCLSPQPLEFIARPDSVCVCVCVCVCV